MEKNPISKVADSNRWRLLVVAQSMATAAPSPLHICSLQTASDEHGLLLRWSATTTTTSTDRSNSGSLRLRQCPSLPVNTYGYTNGNEPLEDSWKKTPSDRNPNPVPSLSELSSNLSTNTTHRFLCPTGESKPGSSFPNKSAIYVWGYNQAGQTGRNGKERLLRIPKQLPPELFGCPAGANSRWLDISCGREHTAAIASDGSLFTWGANDFGQLGDGTEQGRKHPKKVKLLQTEFVKSVSCGAHCTAAIAEPCEKDGTVSTSRLWVWGKNQGSNCPRLFWGAFTPNTIIRQVSCGAVHVVALSEDGQLQAWGYNEHGQLGRGITCEGLQGARVISAFAKFLDEPPELVKITQVSCGEYHTAAISENGEVYTWGLGNMGQLGHCSLQYGDKELIPRRVVALDGTFVKDVACGGVHTCALTHQGGLYAWGGGHAGQLGLGPQSGYFSCIPNGSEPFFRNIPVLVIPSGVQLVACGHSHTLICTRDGRIEGWGYNSYGQAANEKSTYAWYPSPVDWCVGGVRKLAAGGGHSAVLTDACSLKELCEFRLADNLTLKNASEIEDVASRTGSDALVRLCGRLREHLLDAEA